ncbi:MAG: VOC family protein [Deltaproteobacteria bacterium]|nr:VOC family protein [Deltaproteobacteria bacterium]
MAEEPRPTLGLRHAALFCVDLARMEQFYVSVLGYRVEWRPDPDNVYLTSGSDSLALHAGADAARGETRLDHLGVLLDDPEQVDAWASKLAAAGVTLAAAPRTHRDGSRSCYALDPDGNKLQFLFHPGLAGR